MQEPELKWKHHQLKTPRKRCLSVFVQTLGIIGFRENHDLDLVKNLN